MNLNRRGFAGWLFGLFGAAGAARANQPGKAERVFQDLDNQLCAGLAEKTNNAVTTLYGVNRTKDGCPVRRHKHCYKTQGVYCYLFTHEWSHFSWPRSRLSDKDAKMAYPMVSVFAHTKEQVSDTEWQQVLKMFTDKYPAARS